MRIILCLLYVLHVHDYNQKTVTKMVSFVWLQLLITVITTSLDKSGDIFRFSKHYSAPFPPYIHFEYFLLIFKGLSVDLEIWQVFLMHMPFSSYIFISGDLEKNRSKKKKRQCKGNLFSWQSVLKKKLSRDLFSQVSSFPLFFYVPLVLHSLWPIHKRIIKKSPFYATTY